MNIDLVNLSKHVSERECRAMIAAGIIQVSDHYAPTWFSAGCAIDYAGAGQSAVSAVPASHAVMLVIDTPDEADALGYHTELRGRLIAKVFVSPVLENGGTVLGNPHDPGAPSVSSTFSHELLELIGDPYVNWWADGPSLREGSSYSYELSDPCEADGYVIKVADPAGHKSTLSVVMSNFVLPAWFNPEATTGPFDYMGKLTAPFTMSPGGYMVVRHAPGTERQVFAHRESYPAWKLAGKSHALSRTARRGVK